MFPCLSRTTPPLAFFAMQFLQPDDYPVWKEQLLRREAELRTA